MRTLVIVLAVLAAVAIAAYIGMVRAFDRGMHGLRDVAKGVVDSMRFSSARVIDSRP